MSRTVKAQREANQTNQWLTQMNNQTQQEIAEKANQWNWANLQAQNEWNIQQWERENEYNSPKQQVERLMEAGINPLWAMTGSDGGTAQHLESGQPAPAAVARTEAARVSPEYDPTWLSNLVAASRDVTNSALGWSKLGLEAEDVKTRRAGQISSSALDYASAANKRASTTSMETQNRWDLATFGVRVEQESQKLSNMKKQLDLMDSQSENYKAAAANYKASEDLVREKINRIAEDYELRWKEMDIALRNAESNRISATASASNASTMSDRLKLDREFAKQTVAKWNNDQLLDFLKSFGQNIEGKMKGSVGFEGLGVSGEAGVKEKGLPTLTTFEAAGLRALQWAADEPENPKAVEAARIATDTTERIDNNFHVPFAPGASSSNTSVLNPPPIETFGSWSSWQ